MRDKLNIMNFSLDGAPFGLIAGPCVIESEELALNTCEKIKNITSKLNIPFIYKSSYLKDNRTSHESYRGPGLKEGLKILNKVKCEFDVPVLSDVHCEHQVCEASDVLDVLQIPAYLSKQTALALACGESGCAINIKKGQFMSPDDIYIPIRKVESTGNKRIMVTERGTVFGYKDLVFDIRNLYWLKETGYPVVCDITHIVRIPGYTSTDPKGGLSFMVKPLTRAAIAFGCDILFLEVHPDPPSALCDAQSMLKLSELYELLRVCIDIVDAVKR
ncbi:MAG: 3-deoxy-8-phosphooctulonate synthase [Candidatus Coatesbacteria bacterium 4484_99]|uniref:3-deoxy-8-phosphooctulonate synthase n=1 Tax=Candidatus Coatesbacteria bacterium 4484_99 TaxID=1970774 RepID=A0A1W9S3K1_9BACT|nr:MAG: 3-deoxy-8-phosphooctulonate synthase [Candidatus Coatesbacteria bacterium 4484_99]RLC44014.1 MAG: 3-deoxy-8-phosphooctulonate synthase [Candidatus Coatesbacteria bacterium]